MNSSEPFDPRSGRSKRADFRAEEAAARDLLREMLARHAIDTVIDVGANAGQFATSARELGFAGCIHSFEPAPPAFARLETAARGDAEWRAHRVALGAADGTATLNVCAKSDLSSIRAARSYFAERFGSDRAATRAEEVPLARLDTFVASRPGEFGRRWLLKLDTQGFDLEAFAGAAGVLDRIVCLQAELSFIPVYEGAPDWRASIDAFAAAGFLPAGFHAIARRKDLAAIEMDGYFVRAEAGG